jgi:hypothetical protein
MQVFMRINCLMHTLQRRQGERKPARCEGKVCVNQRRGTADELQYTAVGMSFSFYDAAAAAISVTMLRDFRSR